LGIFPHENASARARSFMIGVIPPTIARLALQ
jgi:hypothetical protein